VKQIYSFKIGLQYMCSTGIDQIVKRIDMMVVQLIYVQVQ
jgi:hypothetical protein